MAAAAIDAIKRRQARDELLGTTGSTIQRIPTTPSANIELPAAGTGFWRYQRPAAKVYLRPSVQGFVALLIGGNFLANIVEKWVDPSAEKHGDVWDAIDTFFNVMFAIELLWNMYSFWFWKFWKSAWNVFDFVVVSIGLMNMSRLPLPGPLSLLRMMRAFRVFRLFKRVKSLHTIIVSLGRSMPGVSNGFVVMLLVMSIYSIVGQEFFMLQGSNFTFTNDQNQEWDIITPRGLDYGYDYWGNFGLALYTMFQVFTLESWSEVIARPIFNANDMSQQFGVAFFFVTYLLCVGIALMNVVVAVLLEKMVGDDEDDHRDFKGQIREDRLPEHLETVCRDIETDCRVLKHQLSVVKRYLDSIVESVRSKEPINCFLGEAE